MNGTHQLVNHLLDLAMLENIVSFRGMADLSASPQKYTLEHYR